MQPKPTKTHALLTCAFALSFSAPLRTADSAPRSTPDLLGVVSEFADAMIDRSRAHLPNPHLPLFPIVLTRDGFKIPDAGVQNLKTARVPEEFRTIANPHHDQNIYQVLYALTKITGNKKYAAEADRVIGYFLRNCQEPRHGFFLWGEHLGWDLVREAPGGYPADRPNAAWHEFYRPWVFWYKSFALAPENCVRFAQALWRHQISHQGTLSWSRHASIFKDSPSGRGREMPRHGGFFIATWAAAFRHTGDPEFLGAMEALVGFFESRRHPATGVIPHITDIVSYLRSGEGEEIVYTPSNVSLAVDLHDAAAVVPEPLRGRMLALARSIDESILAIRHDPGPEVKGFVMFCRPENLDPVEHWGTPDGGAKGLPLRRYPYSGGWRSAYMGQYPHTWIVPALTARFQQTRDLAMRRLILACADYYLSTEPDFRPDPTGRPADVEAGTIGNVILLLAQAYEMSGDLNYLSRAEWFCAWALRRFWPDASPLPRASVNEDIYSATSRSDTLVMALLKTWLFREHRESEVVLISSDRS